jgi:hypothetical protein
VDKQPIDDAKAAIAAFDKVAAGNRVYRHDRGAGAIEWSRAWQYNLSVARGADGGGS